MTIPIRGFLNSDFDVQQPKSVLRWEIGSDSPDGRFAFYFSSGCSRLTQLAIVLSNFHSTTMKHCVREISEFYIQAEPSQINELGQLLREFAPLPIEDTERALGGDA